MSIKHLCVVSDLHLWQATDHEELWMRYRQRRFLPDAQFAALISKLCKQIAPGDLTLVLNGDIFDFDLPPVVDGHPVSERSPRTELASVKRLKLILADHDVFLSSLSKLLLRGDRLVFVAGNHDLQLNFPAVQKLLLDRLLAGCEAERIAIDRAELTNRVLFRSWFFSEAGMHVEHGNQYDPYCAVRDPEWPFLVSGRLQTTVGTLTLEHLIGKLGYFNPNVEGTYLLTTKEYLQHFLRYYSRSPRSLLRTFFVGSLQILFELLAENGIHGPGLRDPSLYPPDAAAHTTLFATLDYRATMRLLRIDRMLTLLGLLGLLLLCLLWWPAAIIYALILQFVCSVLKPERSFDLSDVCAEVSKTMRRIVCFYGCRAIVFGHTHAPEGKWESGVFYGNSGTWVPMYHDVACSVIVEESRPFIWLWETDEGLKGGLHRFHNNTIHLVTSQPQGRQTVRRAETVPSVTRHATHPRSGSNRQRVCPQSQSVPPLMNSGSEQPRRDA